VLVGVDVGVLVGTEVFVGVGVGVAVGGTGVLVGVAVGAGVGVGVVLQIDPCTNDIQSELPPLHSTPSKLKLPSIAHILYA
jgi:hypothetical protein